MDRSKPVKRPRKLQVGATQERHRRHRIQAGFSRLYRLLPDFRPDAAVPSKTQLLNNAADFIAQMSSSVPASKVHDLERQVESLKQQLNQWHSPATTRAISDTSASSIESSLSVSTSIDAAAPTYNPTNQIASSDLSANSIVAAVNSTNHVSPSVHATNHIIPALQTANRLTAGVFTANGSAVPSMLVVLPTAVLSLIPPSAAMPRSFVAIAPRPNDTAWNNEVTKPTSCTSSSEPAQTSDFLHTDNEQYQLTASPRSSSPVSTDDTEVTQSVSQPVSLSADRLFTPLATRGSCCSVTAVSTSLPNLSSPSLSSASIPRSSGELGVGNDTTSDRANSRRVCSSNAVLTQEKQCPKRSGFDESCTVISAATSSPDIVSSSSSSLSSHPVCSLITRPLLAPLRRRVPFHWRTSRLSQQRHKGGNVAFIKRSSLAAHTQKTLAKHNVVPPTVTLAAPISSKTARSVESSPRRSHGITSQASGASVKSVSLFSDSSGRLVVASVDSSANTNSLAIAGSTTIAPTTTAALRPVSAASIERLQSDSEISVVSAVDSVQDICRIPPLSTSSSSNTGLSSRALSFTGAHSVSAVADSAHTALITSLVVTSSSSTSLDCHRLAQMPCLASSARVTRPTASTFNTGNLPAVGRSTAPSAYASVPCTPVVVTTSCHSPLVKAVAPAVVEGVTDTPSVGTASTGTPPIATASTIPTTSCDLILVKTVTPAVVQDVAGTSSVDTDFSGTPIVATAPCIPPDSFDPSLAEAVAPSVDETAPCDSDVGTGRLIPAVTTSDVVSRRESSARRNTNRQRISSTVSSAVGSIVAGVCVSSVSAPLTNIAPTSPVCISTTSVFSSQKSSRGRVPSVQVSSSPMERCWSTLAVKASADSVMGSAPRAGIRSTVGVSGTGRVASPAPSKSGFFIDMLCCKRSPDDRTNPVLVGATRTVGSSVATGAIGFSGVSIPTDTVRSSAISVPTGIIGSSGTMVRKRTPGSSGISVPTEISRSSGTLIPTGTLTSSRSFIPTETVGSSGTSVLTLTVESPATSVLTRTVGCPGASISRRAVTVPGSAGVSRTSDILEDIVGTATTSATDVSGSRGFTQASGAQVVGVCWSSTVASAATSSVSLRERITATDRAPDAASSMAVSPECQLRHNQRLPPFLATTTTTLNLKPPTCLSGSICDLSSSASSIASSSTSRPKSSSWSFATTVASGSDIRSFIGDEGIDSVVVTPGSAMLSASCTVPVLVSSSFSPPGCFAANLPRFQSVSSRSVSISSSSSIVDSDQRLIPNSLNSSYTTLLYSTTASSSSSSSTSTSLTSTLLPSFSSIGSKCSSSTHRNHHVLASVCNNSHYPDISSSHLTSVPLLTGSCHVTPAPLVTSVTMCDISSSPTLYSGPNVLCQPFSSAVTRSHYQNSRHINQQQQPRQSQQKYIAAVSRGGGAVAPTTLLSECQYSTVSVPATTLSVSVSQQLKPIPYSHVQPQQRRQSRHLAEQTATPCEKVQSGRQRHQTDRHAMSSVQSIGPPYIHHYKRPSCHQLPLANYPLPPPTAAADERRGSSAGLASGAGDLLAPTSFYPCSTQLSNQAFYTGRVTHPCYEPQYQPDAYHLQNHHHPHHHHQAEYWTSGAGISVAAGHNEQHPHHHLQQQYHHPHQQQQQQQHNNVASSYPAMMALASGDPTSFVSAPPRNSFTANAVFAHDSRAVGLPPPCDVLVPFESSSTARTPHEYLSTSALNTTATVTGVAGINTNSVSVPAVSSVSSQSFVLMSTATTGFDPPALTSVSKQYSGSRRSSRHLSTTTNNSGLAGVKSHQRAVTNSLASGNTAASGPVTSLSSFSVHQLVMSAAVDTSASPSSAATAQTHSCGTAVRQSPSRRTTDKRSVSAHENGRRPLFPSVTSDSPPTKRLRACHGYSTEALLSTPATSATPVPSSDNNTNNNSCAVEETSALALAVGDLTSDDLGSLVPILPPLPLPNSISSSSTTLSAVYTPVDTARVASGSVATADATRCRERTAPQPPLSPIFSSPLKLGTSPSLSCGPDRRLDDLLSVTGLFDCQSLLLQPTPRASSDSPPPPVAVIDDAVSLLTPLFSRPSLAAPATSATLSDCSQQQMSSTENCWSSTPVLTQLNSASVGGSTGASSAHSFNLSCLLPEINDVRQSSDSTLNSHYRIDSSNSQPSNETLAPVVTSC